MEMIGETMYACFNIKKGDFHLDVELQLPAQGIIAFFGPSASGKTTLLRAIAGLETCRAGELRIGQEVWQDKATCLPPHERGTAYVFQEANLFPHLNVKRNLLYALKRVPAKNAYYTLQQVVEMFKLDNLLDRSPRALSGGERQRVAIARALLCAPRLLLMDEPLAALDEESKHEIYPYLEQLHEQLNIPVLYVSHSADEVARLADFLVLMQAGQVLATGPIEEMFTRTDLSLAHGQDAESIIEAEVVGYEDDYHLNRLSFSGGEFVVSGDKLQSGKKIRLRVLARDVSLTLQHARDTSILNIFPAQVEELIEDNPSQYLVSLNAGGVMVLARITRKSVKTLQLRVGQALYMQVKSVAVLA